MTRPGTVSRPVSIFQFPGLVHFIVILLVTTVEIVGLVGWLELETGEGLSSILGSLSTLPLLNQLMSSVGRTGFAAGFLGFFLLVEHVVSQIDQTGRFVSGREFLEILAFSVLEIVVWVVWLRLIPINGILAFVFFLVSLFVEHQITDNVKKRLPFFHFSRVGSRVFLGLTLFTISEVVGAVVWVAQGALLALAVGSLIEHYLARNVGQIRE